MKKIVCISDTHGLHSKMKHKIPKGDILIHAGDWMNSGVNQLEIDSFLTWFKSQQHKVKIVCCGNHDRYMELPDSKFGVYVSQYIKQFYQFFPFIQVSGDTDANIMPTVGLFKVGDLKFYHMPYTLPFMNWGFMRTEKQIEEECLSIPDDVDVIITHGPVWGFRDQVGIHGSHLGCKSLLPAVARCTPKYVIHGHIHDAYGTEMFNSNTTIVNCSICNEDYKPINKPIVITI